MLDRLNVQPELPHSSTEEPLCSRDVVQRDTTRANSHKNTNKRAHPGVASTQDHLQHWNNLSSEISLIPLSCTQTLLPPASLSTHIHTHGLSDARSNWLASEAWVSSGSSVAVLITLRSIDVSHPQGLALKNTGFEICCQMSSLTCGIS